MVMRQATDGWVEFYRAQTDTVPIFRCKIPKDFKVTDVDRIREHLLALVEGSKFGPS